MQKWQCPMHRLRTTKNARNPKRQVQDRKMLVRTVSQTLIHLRKGRNDLVLLDIRYSIVEDDSPV